MSGLGHKMNSSFALGASCLPSDTKHSTAGIQPPSAPASATRSSESHALKSSRRVELGGAGAALPRSCAALFGGMA